MEAEVSNFFKVWLTVLVSLCYCYSIGKTVPEGAKRLVLVLPVICLFFYLPLNLSTIHLTAFTAFFIAWLGNCKLLLFAVGHGPLCSHMSLSLPTFVAIACLPITIKQNPPLKSQNNQNPPQLKSKNKQKPPRETKNKQNPFLKIFDPPINYALKGVILAALIFICDYKEFIHPNVIAFVHCCQLYISLEIPLIMIASLVRTMLRLEIEPPFNEPYRSTSLRDFWSKRWNLAASSVLKLTVYEPIKILTTRLGLIDPNWAITLGTLGAFSLSGIMHELLVYYLGRLWPTGEVCSFFILHGVCLLVEDFLKKKLKGKLRLPRPIASILVIGFVVVTSIWLFLPRYRQCKADVRVFEEYAATAALVKNSSDVLLGSFITSLRL